MFSGGRLLCRCRLFADRLLAALLLFLRLFALGRRRLLLGLKRLGLWNRLAGGRLLPGRRLFGGCGFDLLVLLVLLAQGLWIVVVCRGGLLCRLFSRRLLRLLLLVALLPARLWLLGRSGLFGRRLLGLLLLIALLPTRLLFFGRSGLFGRRQLDLLLLIAPLSARLLFLGWSGLFGRRLLDLLLLIAPLSARLLFLGWSGLFGRRLLDLLLLIALLPAWLLLLGGLLALGRRCLLFRLGPLALGLLFRLRLLLLCAGFC
ncbi:hypothetical protein [Mesorhizobium sp. M0276]|uniref:hypothetical protein n=1 Tax=Mesorhizobium sp. M0276 TaxID=2956928 RepID=UPI00333DF7FE